MCRCATLTVDDDSGKLTKVVIMDIHFHIYIFLKGVKVSSLGQVSLAKNYDVFFSQVSHVRNINVLKASTEANGNCPRASPVSSIYHSHGLTAV